MHIARSSTTISWSPYACAWSTQGERIWTRAGAATLTTTRSRAWTTAAVSRCDLSSAFSRPRPDPWPCYRACIIPRNQAESISVNLRIAVRWQEEQETGSCHAGKRGTRTDTKELRVQLTHFALPLVAAPKFWLNPCGGGLGRSAMWGFEGNDEAGGTVGIHG